MATHQCPVNGCSVVIAKTFAMCRRHWRLVPGPLQEAVWTAYRNAPETPAHFAALKAATEAVDKIIEQPPTRNLKNGEVCDNPSCATSSSEACPSCGRKLAAGVYEVKLKVK